MLIGCFPFFVLAVCLQDDYFEILVWWLDIAEQKDDSLGPLSYYSDCYYFFWILVPDIDVPGSSDLFDFMTSWLHDFTTSLLYHLVQVYIWHEGILKVQQANYDKFAKVQFPLAANGMSPILYLRVQRDQGTIWWSSRTESGWHNASCDYKITCKLIELPYFVTKEKRHQIYHSWKVVHTSSCVEITMSGGY